MTEHPRPIISRLQDTHHWLSISVLITVVVMIIEVVGGILSNSLALLSDAGHMFTHFTALGLALLGIRIARRPATRTKTYGYYRAEILAALVNSVILILLGFYIFYEAYRRFLQPPEVIGPTMLGVAIVGLGANLAVLIALREARSGNINVRSAFLHVLSDTLSSVGVIIAGIIIVLTGAYIADPLVGFLIGTMILIWAVGLTREVVDILLEAAPKHIDMGKIVREVKKVGGVRDLHDLHVWTIASGIYAMSVHLVIKDQTVSRAGMILEEVNDLLRSKFGISHTTIQLECKRCKGPLVCSLSLEKLPRS